MDGFKVAAFSARPEVFLCPYFQQNHLSLFYKYIHVTNGE